MVEVLIKAGASLDIQSEVGCLLNYTMYRSALEIQRLSYAILTCLLHSRDTTLHLCSIRVTSEDIVYSLLSVIRTLHDLAMIGICLPPVCASRRSSDYFVVLSIFYPFVLVWMDFTTMGCW